MNRKYISIALFTLAGSWLIFADSHTVKQGDTLYGISRLYNITVSQLTEWNNIHDQLIKPGQILALQAPAAALPETTVPSEDTLTRKDIHMVEPGESLYGLARRYGMTLKDLKSLNGLTGNNIAAGQKLTVRSTAIWTPLATDEVKAASFRKVEQPDLMSYRKKAAEDLIIKQKEAAADQYTPLSSYLKARNLWNNFDAEIDKLPALSNRLEGVSIVLDPAHGGLDDGSQVKITNKDGEENYISEDEYIYDITLRTYLLLRLHGARVITTIISPDHLIRNEVSASDTLDNNQDEVYNSREFNINDSKWDWPRAGSQAEMQRVEIAQEFTEGRENTFWLSLQAHNSPDESRAAGIYYYRYGSVTDSASEDWAFNLKKSWGRSAFVRGSEFTVLENNPADAALVVSLRNLAYPEETNALLMATSRQMEAESIVTALMHSMGK